MRVDAIALAESEDKTESSGLGDSHVVTGRAGHDPGGAGVHDSRQTRVLTEDPHCGWTTGRLDAGGVSSPRTDTRVFPTYLVRQMQASPPSSPATVSTTLRPNSSFLRPPGPYSPTFPNGNPIVGGRANVPRSRVVVTHKLFEKAS